MDTPKASSRHDSHHSNLANESAVDAEPPLPPPPFQSVQPQLPLQSSSAAVTEEAIARCYDQQQVITGDGSVIDPARYRRVRGKVRDLYVPITIDADETSDEVGLNSKVRKIALVTTDRQSGFDRMLTHVPYKGAVLNLISAFWFDLISQSLHIPHHLIATPHPYVSIVHACTPFPIEFVVRSYLTGSTSTSIWKHYQDGHRMYCGHALSDGMVKNQKLPTLLLTPTTKEESHDRPISLREIMDEGRMSAHDVYVCEQAALQIFQLGQARAASCGLILVDTKYEFGTDHATGTIRLIDEVHTPDSSRYWLASTYEQRLREKKEPDNIDKELLRLWFRDHCDPYHDAILPDAPRELVLELSKRYIALFEMITGTNFSFSDVLSDEAAICKAIESMI